MTHKELKARALSRADTRVAYDELAPEYALLRQMLKARERAGLSQAEVAERMGTKAPAVTRLETALVSGKHSPSIATLQKYARAVGGRLEIRIVKD